MSSLFSHLLVSPSRSLENKDESDTLFRFSSFSLPIRSVSLPTEFLSAIMLQLSLCLPALEITQRGPGCGLLLFVVEQDGVKIMFHVHLIIGSHNGILVG